MNVIAEALLHAEHQHDFSFLQDWTVERFGEIEADAVSRLTARFGEPLPGVEPCLRSGDGEPSTVWQAGDRRLVLQSHFLVGDGDVEIQLWLAAVSDDAPNQRNRPALARVAQGRVVQATERVPAPPGRSAARPVPGRGFCWTAPTCGGGGDTPASSPETDKTSSRVRQRPASHPCIAG
ncbi:hypothetical protein [Streptomyces sp. NPDC049949]|uniref:hypothetical protein n=1 Tax=Streptomyces sp. NPDC049949 TaxID=3154627 RepID=UPI0034403ADC